LDGGDSEIRWSNLTDHAILTRDSGGFNRPKRPAMAQTWDEAVRAQQRF
jgi:hypothetical protein